MRRGVVLIEVLLAATIFGVILGPLLNFLVTGVESSWFGSREIHAQSLAREGLEAVRSIREENWTSLADGNYYLSVADSHWQLVSDPGEVGEEIGVFHRRVVISPVQRDLSGQIVDSGGVIDNATKRITVSISWRSLRDRQLSLSTYLSRYFGSQVWTQTTQNEFNQGTFEYVRTDSGVNPEHPEYGDGVVLLKGGCGANPSGPWIYNDAFQNTWEVHPSGKNNIKEVSQPPGQVYEGQKSLELSSFNGADTKLRNVNSVCTLGFTRLEFYAYNNATIQQSFWITGNQWNAIRWTEVILPPQTWTFISIPYADVSQGDEENLNFMFFKPGVWETSTKFYLDNMTLSGGAGGYYSKGVLTSSDQIGYLLDAGQSTSFHRISYNAILPPTYPTSVGFQIATSNSLTGPWIFYGPGGTTGENDLYTVSSGQGIWLGNNFGRFLRYKAYLFSGDGDGTPALEDVSIYYAP